MQTVCYYAFSIVVVPIGWTSVYPMQTVCCNALSSLEVPMVPLQRHMRGRTTLWLDVPYGGVSHRVVCLIYVDPHVKDERMYLWNSRAHVALVFHAVRFCELNLSCV